ncbi:hypothetical protein BLNAU_9495 [Blattamonas nauphoetae]|uniref:Uncharacterized protein n=1 Tax=Blattamonas nauphoetae TaxID=2049346 RepID=A0ABQ9XVE7_9EUKA|nr:hypothetical protein BLNAU_9495 [Blattamonas nauphoetae]
MLEIEINGFRHSILTSGGGQQSYNILSGYVADGGISTDHSGERAPDSSWGMKTTLKVNNLKKNHRLLRPTTEHSHLAETPPAPPNTLPNLRHSRNSYFSLSTPVALSPILAFATTPAQHRVINKTMT